MTVPGPMYANIVERFFTEFDAVLNNYIYNGYSAMAHYLVAPLGVAVVLYIVILGISISQGWVKLSMSNFVKSALKIAFIYIAAMNWAWFSHYVVDLFTQGAGHLSDVLIDASPIPLPQFAGEGINGAMQSILIEFTKIGAWVRKTGGWGHIGPIIDALVIWAVGWVLVGYAIFELILAKVMMAILFSTAPLFIGFTLFKPTHSFFDRWLGALVGFSLLMIFISATLVLALSFTEWSIGGIFVDKALNFKAVSVLPIVLVAFLGLGIMKMSVLLANSIGGTIRTESASALLAGAVGGVVGAGIAAIKLPFNARGSIGRFLGIGSNSSNNANNSKAASPNMDDIRRDLVRTSAGRNTQGSGERSTSRNNQNSRENNATRR